MWLKIVNEDRNWDNAITGIHFTNMCLKDFFFLLESQLPGILISFQNTFLQGLAFKWRQSTVDFKFLCHWVYFENDSPTTFYLLSWRREENILQIASKSRWIDILPITLHQLMLFQEWRLFQFLSFPLVCWS